MDMIESPRALKRRKLIGEAPRYPKGWCAPLSARTKMIAASCYLPKDDERKPLGEDAHFISEEEQTIGFADGVGGWAKKGVDAGEYARNLMVNALLEIEEQPKNARSPWKALEEAFLSTEDEGSSTACIITLCGLGGILGDFLYAVNIGDSGFLVIRDGKVVYESPTQQHRFNCPYQLGKSSSSDTPDLAQELVVEVQAGDIVVAGTDGLFDNLFPAEIEDIVEISLQKENDQPEMVASTIANIARQMSLLKHSASPFSKAAMDAGEYDSEYMGGKYDDITVIVAYVV